MFCRLCGIVERPTTLPLDLACAASEALAFGKKAQKLSVELLKRSAKLLEWLCFTFSLCVSLLSGTRPPRRG